MQNENKLPNTNEIKELYNKKILAKNIKNPKQAIADYQKMVEEINKEKGINIKTLVVHTGEPEPKKGEIIQQWLATYAYLSNKKDDQKHNEAKQLKTILDDAKKSDKPTGLLIITVNEKEQIQHTNAFVIGGTQNKINNKSVMIFAECEAKYFNNFQGNLLLSVILNDFGDESDINYMKKEVQQTDTWREQLFECNKKLANQFSYIYPERILDGKNTCFIERLIFCEKLLKNDGEELQQLIRNKQQIDKDDTTYQNVYKAKLPLSIMKYTQEQEEEYNSATNKTEKKYFDQIIKEERYNETDIKNQKRLEKIKYGTYEFKDKKGYHKQNNLSYLKAFKLLNKIENNDEIKKIVQKYDYNPITKIYNFINNNITPKSEYITPERIIEYLENNNNFKNKGNNLTRRWNGKKRRYHAFVRALKNASKNQATTEEKQNKQYLRMRDLDEIQGQLSDEIKTKIENIFKSKPTNNLEENKNEGEINQEQNNIQPINLKKKKKKKGKKKEGNTTNQIKSQNKQQEIKNEDSKSHLKQIQQKIKEELEQTGCGCC